MRQLLPQQLTAGTFAPFGTVVQPLAPPVTPGASAPAGARAINDGTAWRLDLLADLDLQREGGTPGLAVYSAATRTLPMRLHTLECHRLGSQGFLPLTGARFVVVVARAGSAPAVQDLQAFVSDGQQGIVLHAGTWHHALLALEAGSFAVVERHAQAAQAVDCALCTLSAPVELLPPP